MHSTQAGWFLGYVNWGEIGLGWGFLLLHSQIRQFFSYNSNLYVNSTTLQKGMMMGGVFRDDPLFERSHESLSAVVCERLL